MTRGMDFWKRVHESSPHTDESSLVGNISRRLRFGDAPSASKERQQQTDQSWGNQFSDLFQRLTIGGSRSDMVLSVDAGLTPVEKAENRVKDLERALDEAIIGQWNVDASQYYKLLLREKKQLRDLYRTLKLNPESRAVPDDIETYPRRFRLAHFEGQQSLAGCIEEFRSLDEPFYQAMSGFHIGKLLELRDEYLRVNKDFSSIKKMCDANVASIEEINGMYWNSLIQIQDGSVSGNKEFIGCYNDFGVLKAEVNVGREMLADKVAKIDAVRLKCAHAEVEELKEALRVAIGEFEKVRCVTKAEDFAKADQIDVDLLHKESQLRVLYRELNIQNSHESYGDSRGVEAVLSDTHFFRYRAVRLLRELRERSLELNKGLHGLKDQELTTGEWISRSSILQDHYLSIKDGIHWINKNCQKHLSGLGRYENEENVAVVDHMAEVNRLANWVKRFARENDIEKKMEEIHINFAPVSQHIEENKHPCFSNDQRELYDLQKTNLQCVGAILDGGCAVVSALTIMSDSKDIRPIVENPEAVQKYAETLGYKPGMGARFGYIPAVFEKNGISGYITCNDMLPDDERKRIDYLKILSKHGKIIVNLVADGGPNGHAVVVDKVQENVYTGCEYVYIRDGFTWNAGAMEGIFYKVPIDTFVQLWKYRGFVAKQAGMHELAFTFPESV